MNLLNKIKRKWKYFKSRWKFLRVLNSPFKPLKLHWYFGNIERGVPYFFPRKMIKSKNKPGYYQFKYLKYFGFNWCSLGYKTKWSPTDYRFEWSPMFSLVIFGKQLHITVLPKINPSDTRGKTYTGELSSLYIDEYWQAWLVYHYHTDLKLSKKERLKQCKELHPAVWEGANGKINCYDYILKEKYLR